MVLRREKRRRYVGGIVRAVLFFCGRTACTLKCWRITALGALESTCDQIDPTRSRLSIGTCKRRQKRAARAKRSLLLSARAFSYLRRKNEFLGFKRQPSRPLLTHLFSL